MAQGCCPQLQMGPCLTRRCDHLLQSCTISSKRSYRLRQHKRMLQVCAQQPQQEDGHDQQAAAQQLQLPLQQAQGPVRWTGDYLPGHLLGGRYRVIEVLGRGGNAVTYKARDESSGREVAVKVLSLRGMNDWKQLELFEREAQTLKMLQHPGIPQYLQYFEEDTERDRGFFLVQELADGVSLAELMRSGWRADEAEAVRIARELLQVLQYLAGRRPAVIHRDVKPENIVLRGGRPGGRVCLVDFGGVQAMAAGGEDGRLGSTIVGSYGFMPPEQFRGEAQPASDLYGLGASLLFLLSGRPPSSFPQQRLRIDLGGLQASAELAAVLEGLLEPLVEDRLSAEEALELLEEVPRDAEAMQQRRRSAAAASSSSQQLLRQQPAGGRCTARLSAGRLEVDIPPARLGGEAAYSGAFALAWNAFVATWTVSALAGGGLLFAAFSLPFWAAGISLGRLAIGRSLLQEKVRIGRRDFEISQQLAYLKRGGPKWLGSGKVAEGQSRDLTHARVEAAGSVNGNPRTHIRLQEGVRKYILGEALELPEQVWLARCINAQLRRNGQEVPAEMDQAPRFPESTFDSLNDLNWRGDFFDDD